jgi:hypothetical protein
VIQLADPSPLAVILRAPVVHITDYHGREGRNALAGAATVGAFRWGITVIY